MIDNPIEKEVDTYYPPRHALIYYRKMLAGLLDRVERVKDKIAKLEEDSE